MFDSHIQHCAVALLNDQKIDNNIRTPGAFPLSSRQSMPPLPGPRAQAQGISKAEKDLERLKLQRTGEYK